MPFRFSVNLFVLVQLALCGCGAKTAPSEHPLPAEPSTPSEDGVLAGSAVLELLEAADRPAVTLRVQSGTVSSPLRAFLEDDPGRLIPCFEERLRRQGFLLGRFAIVVDAEGRFADSVNRMGRSYLRLELSAAERRCVAEGLDELALPTAPESWPAIVEFNDPAVLRSDENRDALASVRQQYCEGPMALSDFDCAMRYVVYEPAVRVRVSECSVESCQPVVEALSSRLPMLSHCLWFTHDEAQFGGSAALSLVFDEGGALVRATQELGGRGQAPNRQELAAMDGEESCKPEGLRAGCEQQLGATGQAPNRQEPAGAQSILSGTADAGVARCLAAALDGLRSSGPLESSLVFDFGSPTGGGAGLEPR